MNKTTWTTIGLLFFAHFAFAHIPYSTNYKTIVTKHFTVLYPEHKAEMADLAADYAEAVYDKITPYIEYKPKRRIPIIISDQTDLANGYAQAHYQKKIVLYTASLDTIDGLRDSTNPLYNLILHELTHIFQLDQLSGAAYFWRVMSGFLYFPGANAFPWYHEGLAVYAESRESHGGRLDNSYMQGLMMQLAATEKIPKYTQLATPVLDWPYGEATYYIGARFTEYLIKTYGAETYAKFNKDLSNDFWPFVFEFMLKFKKHYGKPIKKLWEEWQEYEYEYWKKPEHTGKVLKNITAGQLGFVQIHNDAVYFSGYSKSKGSGVYRVENKKQQRLFNDFIDKAEVTDEAIYYLKAHYGPSERENNAVYRYVLNTKIKTKLRKSERITNFTLNPTNQQNITYVRDNKLYQADINKNTIVNEKEILVEGYATIVDISTYGNKIAISGRLKDQTNYVISMIDAHTNEQITFNNVAGKAPQLLDEKRLLFTGKLENLFDSPFLIDLTTHQLVKLITQDAYAQEWFMHNDQLYYKSFYKQGMGLYHSSDFKDNQVIMPTKKIVATSELGEHTKEKKELDELIEGDSFVENVEQSLNKSFSLHKLSSNENGDFEEEKWLQVAKVKIDTAEKLYKPYYNPFAWLYPLYWFPVIKTYEEVLNAPMRIYYDAFPMPIPGVTLGGFDVLERFHYELTTMFDYYYYYYPIITLDLNWSLPNLNLSYLFETNTSSFNEDHYFQKLLKFRQMITIVPYFYFNSFSMMGFPIQADVNFFTDFDTKTSFFYSIPLYTGVIFEYKRALLGSYKWNAGSSFELGGVVKITDGKVKEAYMLVQNKIKAPLGKHAWYLNQEFATNLLNDKIFWLGGGNVITMRNNFFGFLYDGIQTLKMSFILSLIGNTYIATGTGFEFTAYRRTHYFGWGTMGFRGVQLRVFNEFALFSRGTGGLYRNPQGQSLGGFMDAGFEIQVDFFMYYGNVNISFNVGHAIGVLTSLYPESSIYSISAGVIPNFFYMFIKFGLLGEEQ